MPELDITAFDPHVYDVTITDQSGLKTEHCVTVHERLVRDLGIAASQEPALEPTLCQCKSAYLRRLEARYLLRPWARSRPRR